MNKIVLMGRLARDPELHNTNNGNAVCNITVAVNRDFGDGADFIDCVAWKKTAEMVSKHFHKGSNILIEGSLQSRKFEDKSGNKRVAWEVLIDRVHFVDGKKKSDTEPQTEEAIDDSDCPF